MAIYTSKFMLESNTFLNETVVGNFSWPRTTKWGLVIIAALFPVHFSNIGQILFKTSSIKLRQKLKISFQHYATKQGDIQHLQVQMKKVDKGLLELTQLNNGNGILDTIFEILPSCILMTGLLVLS